MVTRVIAPDPAKDFITQDNKIPEHVRRWTDAITRQSIIVGTGSPIGVVGALQTSLYMDETGAPGAVLYIKQNTDIAGDQTLGWVAIG